MSKVSDIMELRKKMTYNCTQSIARLEGKVAEKTTAEEQGQLWGSERGIYLQRYQENHCQGQGHRPGSHDALVWMLSCHFLLCDLGQRPFQRLIRDKKHCQVQDLFSPSLEANTLASFCFMGPDGRYKLGPETKTGCAIAARAVYRASGREQHRRWF